MKTDNLKDAISRHIATLLKLTQTIEDEKARGKLNEEILSLAQTLKEDVSVYKHAFDTISDAIWLFDKEQNVIAANKATRQIFNFPPETVLNKKCWFLVHKTDIPVKNCPFVRSKKTNRRETEIFRIGEKWVEVLVDPLIDKNGNFTGAIHIARDITQQKISEKLIRESEARYKELFETAPVGYLILNKNGVVLEANKTVLRRFGYKKKELIGRNIREFVPKEDIPIVNENIKLILTKNFLHTEARTLTKAGKRMFLLLREKKIKLPNGEVGILSASINITKRKEAERKLKEREEQLTTLINTAPEDIVCFKDGNGKWLLANNTLLKVFNLSKVNYVGKTDAELSKIADPFYKKAFRECIKSDKAAWEAKKPRRSIETIIKPSGEKYIFDIIKVPLFNNDGTKKGLVLLGRNITQLVKIQELIQESEEKFHSVWENSLDPMKLQDENEVLVNVNKAFCEFVGLSRKEILGKKITEVIKVKQRAKADYKKAFKERKLPSYHKTEFTLRNNEKRIMEVSNSFIELRNGKTFLLTIFRDVTNYHKLIEELTAAKEKAEEINKIKTQFFLYMSHELRSPFVGIIGYAELLYEQLENEKHKKMAKGIFDTSVRMIRTLSNILDLTKLEFDENEKKIERINVNELIETVTETFGEWANSKKIKLKTTLPKNPVYIDADERMLYGIIENLVHNAIKFTDEGFVKIFMKKRKKKLILGVVDSGIGIPPNKQEVIWHEFRQVSEGIRRKYQGSGLGLTIVKKFTEMLGGKISLKSEVGKGSTFEIEFPVN